MRFIRGSQMKQTSGEVTLWDLDWPEDRVIHVAGARLKRWRVGGVGRVASSLQWRVRG